ncbi:TPA: pheST operon leader peptide PheM [Escherichia coli]|nr:pheST operon leader peptide PheM [Enterobacter hormaechei]EEZ7698640.1 pheST operon leader peptide PheM [Escherichia coli]HCK2666592.1 pheST operon leader peptide PheM [Escherichia coli]HCK2671416.1 pheST operon leader peptide PheM [Escherichia coli]
MNASIFRFFFYFST